ncbi:uncharacterized protein LMH87_007710 [Akanthomyces muscarius]|uniref:JmjC domain-containing protein n=1 Tax=Akanthomyces muscarius TaxID=2231603 RepID=A0A9W8QKR6_AKAMU|nr:uncharacterized protein LMH87_007710 [Akanthomyces muscarius]KAJ4161686.1 hypothetical protein LMH87_007710 [Akanthomyces muscarius]
MHHNIKHQRCRACSRVFIHNQGRLARDKRPEHTCESPEWEDVPLMPDHTLSVFDPQAKYAEKIKSVLKKCREMVVNEEDAYWHTNIRLLKEMFPSDNISFAKLGSSAQPSDLIDVYSVTECEAKELLARDQAMTQPILIKGSQNTPDDPMQTLCDRFRLPGSKVSIQDAREKERTPVSMPVDEAIGAIRRETTICGGLPFTILDLEFLGQIPPIPECLHDNRFAVMQAIDSRLQVASRMNEEKTGAGPGKKSSAAVIHEGAFTGFHVDTPGGTWVRTMSGLKAWIFASRTAPINDFQEQGSDWAPDVNVIILEPGDCLIMPTAIPHAVLTIADSWMHGAPEYLERVSSASIT